MLNYENLKLLNKFLNCDRFPDISLNDLIYNFYKTNPGNLIFAVDYINISDLISKCYIEIEIPPLYFQESKTVTTLKQNDLENIQRNNERLVELAVEKEITIYLKAACNENCYKMV